MESDRRGSPLYQPGSGRVLSHFASIATPDARKDQWPRGAARSVSRPPRQSAPKVFDDFVLDNQTESSDRSSELSAETAEPKSYAMSFSPPRHSLKKSRRELSTARATFRSSSSGLRAGSRVETAVETVEEESHSPVAASVEFLMSRDPEEEEKVLNAKSDKEKAYLYKKVGVEEEKGTGCRGKALTCFGWLVEQHLNEPADYQQAKKIQALCREVTGLVMQLGQRDTLINSLHEERDRSARVINELKLSQGLSSSNVSEAMRSTGELRDVEQQLQAALREKQQALEREASVVKQLKDLQLLYEKCEAARSALSDGLDRAEEQTTALHAQWVQEKKELLASVKKDDQKSATFAVERERLGKDNEELKASLCRSSEAEKKHLSTIEAQRIAADKSKSLIAQLERELDELRPQLDVLKEKDERINMLEKDLVGTRDKLRRCLLHVDELEERLEQKTEEANAAKVQFQKRGAFLEQRVFSAEAVRRCLHNKVCNLMNLQMRIVFDHS
ncbi:unnamed protein product [Phytophthora lilii]|uniref:Unnamed protein product n=1 Tax=Phytophthora lilii TaxID=2077276 RepID=A0A9W6WST9_9STRA|nr:unnamed protein product [Phytophthora lilii]